VAKPPPKMETEIMTHDEHGKVWQDAARKMKEVAGQEPDTRTSNLMLVMAMAMTIIGNSYVTHKEGDF
jgi:hypothetical protein